MSKRYKLLKDIQSPAGCAKAGTWGNNDGFGRVWFGGMYWNEETCEANREWFQPLPEKIEVELYPKGNYGTSSLHLCYFGTSKQLSETELLAVKSAIYNVLNGTSTSLTLTNKH